MADAYRVTIAVPCIRRDHYEGPMRASCRLLYKNGYKSVASANLIYVFEIENFTNTAVTIPVGAPLQSMQLRPGVKMTKMFMTVDNIASFQHEGAAGAVHSYQEEEEEEDEEEGLASPSPPYSPTIGHKSNSNIPPAVDSTTEPTAAAVAAAVAAAPAE